VSRYISARFSFDATHNDPLETQHLHGHRFEVEVSEQTEVTSKLREHLAEVCRELHLRSLDEMLTGGSQTGQGIASWILERLLINHPKITRIELWWEPDFRYGVTRDIR
jgi:6-pyruvoyl-tetrahydropterin synthase